MRKQIWVRYNRAKGTLSAALLRSKEGHVMVDQPTLDALFSGDSLTHVSARGDGGWYITEQLGIEILREQGYVKCDEWDD